MTSIITDNCYGRGLKCNVMSNFVEIPIDGRFLSSYIEVKNMWRRGTNEDIVNIPFDLVKSVDFNAERRCYWGNGVARTNYISKRNCYGEHR